MTTAEGKTIEGRQQRMKFDRWETAEGENNRRTVDGEIAV